jgi:hypothetical protein
MSAVEASVFRHPSSTVDQVVLNADGSFGGELASELGSKLPIAGGKILQIVRATDTTNRSTTSQYPTFVDVTGMSVTISPQKTDSAIYVMAIFQGTTSTTSAASDNRGFFRITTSGNTALSGTQEVESGVSQYNFTTSGATRNYMTLVGFATPNTTNATTYKLRFCSGQSTTTTGVPNNSTTGQMLAIEVSA